MVGLSNDMTFHGVIGIGGALCLEFMNTHEWPDTEKAVERLQSFVDLLDWARAIKLIDRPEAEALLKAAKSDPAGAQGALHQARAFRDAMFYTCQAMIRRRPPSPAKLQEVNMYLSKYLGAAEISPRLRRGTGASTLELSWHRQTRSLEGFLGPVAWSFIDLMKSDEGRYVKECATPGCQWIFVDRTKNHRRKWCLMSHCGNRAKARRFYARHKAARARAG